MKNTKLFLAVFILFFEISLFTACANVEESIATPELSPGQLSVTETDLVTKNTSTVSPSLTPIFFDSAFCFSEIEQRINWMKQAFQLNEDCMFPCVANHAFVMGETTPAKAFQRLDCVYGEASSYLNDNTMEYLYRLDENESVIPDWLDIAVRNDEIIFSHFAIKSQLSDFLKLYGPPDEIWAWGEGIEKVESVGYFNISLYYKKLGAIVVLSGDTNSGKYVNICPSQLDDGVILVLLFNPELSAESDFLTISNEARQFYFLVNEAKYPLEEISDIDVDWFYSTYLQRNSDECFSMLSVYCYRYPESTFCSLVSTPIP